MTAVTLAEIVSHLGGDLVGDGAIRIRGIATLENADAGSITFLSNPKYQKLLAGTRASAVILAPQEVAECKVPCIVTPQPYLYFARLVQWLNPVARPAPGVHPSAVVESAIPPSVSVGPCASIGAGVSIGNNVVIGPGCRIGAGVHLGSDTILNANVTIYAGCHIGARNIFHSGVVIGADGFGLAKESDGRWMRIPQIGRVVTGDDVEIGANTCIDRGAIEDTVIEDGVKLDNLIQVAHNVRIGAHTAIAGCTGIAGSAVIGKRCTIAGASSIIGHIEIADDVTILVASVVTRSISRAGTYAGTVPSQPYDEWRRNYSRLRHLDDMADKIRSLEKRLAELERSK